VGVDTRESSDAAKAAFNSITPITWVAAYLFEHARRKDADSADRSFELAYAAGTALGLLVLVIAITTQLGGDRYGVSLPGVQWHRQPADHRRLAVLGAQ
jgi:hypothetical protein